ncbi:MAG: hypothetical protein ACYC44_00565 [Patescibacteria group bacterium]
MPQTSQYDDIKAWRFAMDFANIAINDLTEDVFAQAAQTSEDAFALLDRLAKIAVPNKCEAKVLRFFSRIALRATDGKLRSWAAGDLRVEIRPLKAFCCEIKLLRDKNGMLRLLRRVTLQASIQRFHEAGMDIKRILPFMLVTARRDLLVLEAKAEIRRNTIPPRSFAKAERAMLTGKSLAQPPLPRDMAPTLLESESQSFPDETPTAVRVKPLGQPAPIVVTKAEQSSTEATEASVLTADDIDDVDDNWG